MAQPACWAQECILASLPHHVFTVRLRGPSVVPCADTPLTLAGAHKPDRLPSFCRLQGMTSPVISNYRGRAAASVHGGSGYWRMMRAAVAAAQSRRAGEVLPDPPWSRLGRGKLLCRDVYGQGALQGCTWSTLHSCETA